jgi:hypothetical protein
LTAPATAYYLRGDECPRCLTPMVRAERFRDVPADREADDEPAVAASHSAA